MVPHGSENVKRLLLTQFLKDQCNETFVEWVISKFNGKSTPKGSYSAKTAVNCHRSLNRVHYQRMLWSNECKVQGKMSSHILKKRPIALTYSRIVEGVTESNRSFMFLTSKYSLRTALCESIRYQAKSEQNVRQNPIPRVRHGEAALTQPETFVQFYLLEFWNFDFHKNHGKRSNFLS